MTDTPATLPSLRVLVRHPLSALRPSAAVIRAADRCAGVLRHPRSRIRVAPGWKAPSLRVNLPAGPARVFLSRHRVSAAMWRRLTGSGREENPPHGPLYLVTLSAFAVPSELNGPVRNMTSDVHSMFRRTLCPVDPRSPGNDDALGDRVAWHTREACGASVDDRPHLEWTWHVLISGEPGANSLQTTHHTRHTSQGSAA